MSGIALSIIIHLLLKGKIMNHLKLIKGACCALIMMSSEFAIAGWENINTDVNITKSRAVLDRVNRVFHLCNS